MFFGAVVSDHSRYYEACWERDRIVIVNQEHILKIMSKKNRREVVFLLIGSSLFAGGAIVFLFMGPAQELNEYFRRSEGRAKRGPELLVSLYN